MASESMRICTIGVIAMEMTSSVSTDIFWLNGTNPRSVVVMDNLSVHHTDEVPGLLIKLAFPCSFCLPIIQI